MRCGRGVCIGHASRDSVSGRRSPAMASTFAVCSDNLALSAIRDHAEFRAAFVRSNERHVVFVCAYARQQIGLHVFQCFGITAARYPCGRHDEQEAPRSTSARAIVGRRPSAQTSRSEHSHGGGNRCYTFCPGQTNADRNATRIACPHGRQASHPRRWPMQLFDGIRSSSDAAMPITMTVDVSRATAQRRSTARRISSALIGVCPITYAGSVPSGSTTRSAVAAASFVARTISSSAPRS